MTEAPRDTSDAKQVAKLIETAKNKDAQLKEALLSIMRTVEGRMWIKSLLVKCGPYATPFSTDPILMAKNCGEANIGLQVIAELHAASADLYLQMMKENPNG